MSATRDKSQKFAFVYSNLYEIYKKGKDAPKSSSVLKTEDLKSGTFGHVRVEAYSPVQMMNARVRTPAQLKPAEAKTIEKLKTLASPPTHHQAVQSLKENLKALNDLHSRLRFMLEELEELVKEN